MSAERWSTLRDARQLLSLLDGEMAHSVPQRKWQHFGTACCREVWSQITVPECRRVVEIGEAYTDGTATIMELETARYEVDDIGCRLPQDSHERATVKLCYGAVIDFESYASSWAARAPARHTKSVVDDVITLVAKQTKRGLNKKVETLQRQLADLLHDVFGNPFRPVAFDPAWRTEHAVGIAGKMYDERAFAAMPILADALEEAGCDNQDILSHCREPGVHVRGCWVVDLVLGK